MKILGLIPARGGSKAIPGKNIKELAGKPLLNYTYEAAKNSKNISRCVLSSDNDDIIEVANRIGLEVPFKRPTNLADDKSPTLDVIKHALLFFKKQNVHFDAVCLLQVTSPFKTTQFIDTAIEEFVNSGADSLISVQKVPDKFNPHWTFLKDNSNLLRIATSQSEIISRRQDLPVAFHRDGIIYLTKTEVLLNDNSMYGAKVAYIESPKEFNVNIDSEKDWNRAESMIQSFNKS